MSQSPAAKALCGIYAITHVPSGRRYIGRATQIGPRLYQHRLNLRKRQHTNSYLQATFDKYGEQDFTFAPLFVCAKELTPFYEARAIRGMVRTAEERAAISASLKAFYAAHPERRVEQSVQRKGRPGPRKGVVVSAETRKKMVIAGKARAACPVERARLAQIATRGRVNQAAKDGV